MNLEIWMPIITLLITTGLGVMTTYLKKKWDIDVEANDRDALHSAITNGLQAAISRNTKVLVPTPEQIEPVKQVLVNDALDYVTKSVPDALSRLHPGAGVLSSLVLGKLEEIVQKNVNKR